MASLVLPAHTDYRDASKDQLDKTLALNEITVAHFGGDNNSQSHSYEQDAALSMFGTNLPSMPSDRNETPRIAYAH